MIIYAYTAGNSHNIIYCSKEMIFLSTQWLVNRRHHFRVAFVMLSSALATAAFMGGIFTYSAISHGGGSSSSVLERTHVSAMSSLGTDNHKKYRQNEDQMQLGGGSGNNNHSTVEVFSNDAANMHSDQTREEEFDGPPRQCLIPPEKYHQVLELRTADDSIHPFLNLTATNKKVSDVYDVFVFNNELDMLEMRLLELWDVVDWFVLIESRFSQSGVPKPLYFQEEIENKSSSRFLHFLPKIKHVKYEEQQLPDSARGETVQRGLAMQVLKDVAEDTIIMLSDVDEIPLCRTVFLISHADQFILPRSMYGLLEMPIHYYSFRWRRKTANRIVAIRDSCTSKVFRRSLLNQLSLESLVFAHHSGNPVHWIFPDAGVHCSYCMSTEMISKKLKAFAHREYGGEPYNRPDYIDDHVRRGVDLFDRAEVIFQFHDSMDDIPFAARTMPRFQSIFFPPFLAI